jgi:hypothetical protein
VGATAQALFIEPAAEEPAAAAAAAAPAGVPRLQLEERTEEAPASPTPAMERLGLDDPLAKLVVRPAGQPPWQVRETPTRPSNWANFSLLIAVFPQECMGQLPLLGPT